MAARSSSDAPDPKVPSSIGGDRRSARAIRVPSRVKPAIVEEPFMDLAAAAAVRLRTLAERVELRRPIATHALSFDLADLSDPATAVAIDAGLKTLVTREERAIYQFSLRDPNGYELLRDAFHHRPLHHERDGRELRYSRLTKSAQPGALYVGSGRDLRQRIGQHLGRIGGPGTYSMRLAGWAKSVEATVDLRYWLYERDMDPIELEALEQELWDARTPFLGKRSGR